MEELEYRQVVRKFGVVRTHLDEIRGVLAELRRALAALDERVEALEQEPRRRR